MDVKNKNPKPKGQCFFEGFTPAPSSIPTYTKPVVKKKTIVNNEYSELLHNNTIAGVKRLLIKKDNDNKLTKPQFEAILAAEKGDKNRNGIKKWIGFSIIIGKLAGDFFLDYYDKVSIFKSSLQKYVRRSETDKAVACAKSLFLSNKQQALNRIKIIITEDVVSAVETVKYIHADMDIKTYLQVVKCIANAPKDKRAWLMVKYFTDSSAYPYSLNVSDAIKAEKIMNNVKYGDKLKDEVVLEVVKGLYTLVNPLDIGGVWDIIKRDEVTESLVNRAMKGTYFDGDKWQLLIAAVYYHIGDYLLKDVELPEVNVDEVEQIKLKEIDWYCMDFHTPVGRRALRIYLSKNRQLSEDALKTTWFISESAKAPDTIGPWLDTSEYDKEWEKHKEKIKETIIYLCGKFELDKLD